MNKYGLVFQHIGLACKDPSFATLFYRNQGYEIAPVVFDPEQEVSLIMCRKNNEPEIEIIYSENQEKGPLKSLLKERDAQVYHLCYSTKDVAASLRLMKEDGLGVVCVSPPKHAVLFGKKVSFYLVRGLGIIEFIHET